MVTPPPDNDFFDLYHNFNRRHRPHRGEPKIAIVALVEGGVKEKKDCDSLYF